MDNRFGFKDLLLTVLMIVLIVSVWLSMKQTDRQWDLLQQLVTAQGEQNDTMRRLVAKLDQGVVAPAQDPTTTPTTNGQGADDVPAFEPIRKARNESNFAMGDHYVQSFGVAVGKLTPLTSSDVYASVMQDFVLEPLARRDPRTLKWQALLAESWEQSDDGLTITFDLRRNVRFSDDSPFTAADVVFTYDWIMNPKVDAPRVRAYFEKIESVTADSDYRVTFKLNETYFKGFEICAGLQILSRKYYGQFTPQQFNELPGLLFGSGPYKLPIDPQTWQPGGDTLVLVRNEQYWGLAPAIERLAFRQITDDTARLTTFTNRELDSYAPTPEQYPSMKNDQSILDWAELYEYETITGGYRYIGWNQKRDGKPTRFADARVRRAMTMLTNRQAMCRDLMVGLATVTTGPFHRLTPQYNEAVEPWPYDPKAARELLKEAGYEDRDGDGIIEDAQGKPFSFKLIYPASSINYKQMAFYLKDTYARAGVLLEPDPLEWTIMIQRINTRNFDAMTLGWSGSIEGDPNQIFHSNQIADGGDNYIAYRNTKLDDLIDAARKELDEKQRMELWHQVHSILHEDQPYTFLFTRKAVRFIDKRFQNVELTRLGVNDETEWYVPAEKQKWTK